MSADNLREKNYYRDKTVELVKKIKNPQKGELLYRIISTIEILPVGECQRILDYLSELYLS